MKTFLTKKQIEVLKRRMEGKTLEEIASEFGTTKQNISAIERKARENYQKALNTVKLFRSILAPIVVRARAGMKVDDVVRDLYERCDSVNIHIPYDRFELVMLLRKEIGHRIRHSLVVEDFEIRVTKEGDVIVMPE
ncbi:Tfx family DNA-binding protein [Methanosarcinales archaeon]|nr:MAG: Tfx family DNA-binding protein [Methanosarcinales archaeon]